MNSIKELVKQSTTDSSGKWLSLEDAERLVETVVKECAEIARLNTRVDSKLDLMIQEHFGVER